MKTSNKLLAILAALVLIVPLLVILSFKSAISKNQYVIKDIHGHNAAAFTKVQPFKVLKIQGAVMPDLLKCNIYTGPDYAYKYTTYYKDEYRNLDSSFVQLSGDTLFVTYTQKRLRDGKEYYSIGCELSVTVPSEVTVLAGKATVNIGALKPFAQKGKADIALSDNAVLNVKGFQPDEHYTYDIANEKTEAPARGYNIESVNGVVNLTGQLKIGSLELNAREKSSIRVDKNVSIDSVSGAISAGSVINAPYSFIQKLKPLSD